MLFRSKRLRDIEKDTGRNEHRAAMRQGWLDRRKKRLEKAYPRGWGMEERIAQETYPNVSLDLAITLRRLLEDNEMSLIRDLRLGDDVTISDIFDFGSPELLEHLADRFGLDMEHVRYVQDTGLPGVEKTDKMVMTYADAGDLYKAVVEYLSGGGRLKNVYKTGRTYEIGRAHV